MNRGCVQSPYSSQVSVFHTLDVWSSEQVTTMLSLGLQQRLHISALPNQPSRVDGTSDTGLCFVSKHMRETTTDTSLSLGGQSTNTQEGGMEGTKVVWA